MRSGTRLVDDEDTVDVVRETVEEATDPSARRRRRSSRLSSRRESALAILR